MIAKKFIHRNDAFVCFQCGTKVPQAKVGCRNHCPGCLFSLHLDEHSPGDRSSQCQGLMKPTRVEQSRQKGFSLVYKCLQCGKIVKNKVAPDDDWDEVIKISSRPIV